MMCKVFFRTFTCTTSQRGGIKSEQEGYDRSANSRMHNKVKVIAKWFHRVHPVQVRVKYEITT